MGRHTTHTQHNPSKAVWRKTKYSRDKAGGPTALCAAGGGEMVLINLMSHYSTEVNVAKEKMSLQLQTSLHYYSVTVIITLRTS